jgi:hypothetical protein
MVPFTLVSVMAVALQIIVITQLRIEIVQLLQISLVVGQGRVQSLSIAVLIDDGGDDWRDDLREVGS